MRILLYHPWIYLTGGAERVLTKLVEHSEHDWVVATHRYDAHATFPAFADMDVIELGPRVSVERSFKPLLHACRTIAATDLPDVGADALLVSSEGLGDLVMARATLPAAVYCHTPLKIRHDVATRRALVERSPAHALASAMMGPAFDTVSRSMWRRYHHRFANSAETRQRIVDARFARADEVEVLHPGVDVDEFVAAPAPVAGPDPHEPVRVLVAGRIMWQKRIETAIEAFRSADVAGAELVVAGAVDAKSEDYLEHLRQRASGLPVRFEIGPTDTRLKELYRSSRAVVFTPPNEDFGIVPLEAMAAGTPVMACASGGVVETVVDGVTGWLLPNDVEAFARRMRSVLQDGVDVVMREAAAARAGDFAWSGFARRIDHVMAEVAATAVQPSPLGQAVLTA